MDKILYSNTSIRTDVKNISVDRFIHTLRCIELLDEPLEKYIGIKLLLSDDEENLCSVIEEGNYSDYDVIDRILGVMSGEEGLYDYEY